MSWPAYPDPLFDEVAGRPLTVRSKLKDVTLVDAPLAPNRAWLVEWGDTLLLIFIATVEGLAFFGVKPW